MSLWEVPVHMESKEDVSEESDHGRELQKREGHVATGRDWKRRREKTT